MNTIFQHNIIKQLSLTELPRKGIVLRCTSIFVLFYPSIPYFSLGWGSNIPFFLASLLVNIHYLRKNTIIDKHLLLFIATLPIVFFAALIVYYKIGSFSLTVPILGLRQIITDFSILMAMYFIVKNNSLSLTIKVLLVGLLLNFLYGFIEIIYPMIKDIDYVFHELNKNDDYLLREEFARIRILWQEPSMSATYMILVLPLFLFMKKVFYQRILLLIWVIIFLKIASKGVLFFAVIAGLIFSIFRLKSSFILLYKNLKSLILLCFITITSSIIFQSELTQTVEYIADILHFTFSKIIGVFSIKELFDLLYASNLSSSQYSRIISLFISIQNFFYEPYAFITGFTPYGNKYYYIYHPELIPDLMYSKIMYKFNVHNPELHEMKGIVQSSFFDIYVSYGIAMFLFMIATFYKSYRNFQTIFNNNILLFFYIWIFLITFFMWTLHIYVIFFMYYLISIKLTNLIRIDYAEKNIVTTTSHYT